MMQVIQNMTNRRRVTCCSFCRREGHNIVTCNDERLIKFEIDCCIECQSMNMEEFKVWLRQKYFHLQTLIKTFSAKKCNISVSRSQNTLVYLDAISNYIYQTYKYSYEIDQPSGFEADLIRILDELRIPIQQEEEPIEENMEAALQSDIRSGLLFLDMRRTIAARRIEKPKKFIIESVFNPLSIGEKKEIEECCICFDSYNKKEFIRLNCNHEFCNDCLKKSLISDTRDTPCCAYCRTEITTMTSRTIDIYDKMSELVV
jgi:hypothetical protein